MRKFSDLFEAPQTIVFAFGRFNPPTIGHEKLINKVAYMRKMFPKHRKNIIADKNAKTAIMIAEMLYKEGFKNLVMVAGSDRLKEFSVLLNRYNDASLQQRVKIDQIIMVKYGKKIDKLAKKMVMKLKKKELERVKAARANLNA